MPEETTYQLELSKDQALVFFDFLARINENEQATSRIFADQAEQRVLWDLEAMLESKISESFRSDYGELLEGARARTRDAAE